MFVMHNYIIVLIIIMCVYKYNGTSDKGPSKKGTASLQGTPFMSSKVNFPIVLIHFKPPREDNLPTKDKMTGPKVSFIQRLHCSLSFVKPLHVD